MTAVLGGADIVVFTGGVGEHTAEVRAECGVTVDPAANTGAGAAAEISTPGATPRTFVVTARRPRDRPSGRALLAARYGTISG